MSITSFVSGSAFLLALWLGVTFFHEVSPLHNPNLPKTTAAAKPSDTTPAGLTPPAARNPAADEGAALASGD